MKKFLLFLIFFSVARVFAQDDIVLNLDSIKNIKTTRYSSINEVGVNINIKSNAYLKFPDNKVNRQLELDKPGVLFRTVHGVLIKPNFFIGGGVGVDFTPTGNGGTLGTVSKYYLTIPLFLEMREYILDGSFNIFFSERLGGGFFFNPQLNKYTHNANSSGAFAEFQIGGRYTTPSKKLAIHFGVGYRLQHLQNKVDFSTISQSYSGAFTATTSKIGQIILKHYVPIVIGVTF